MSGSPPSDRDNENAPTLDKSAIASEIEDLHQTILRFAKNQETLPQPLFWSLFNSRITQIKRNKDIARVLKDVLGS
jgi:hypothetical protein